MKTQETKHTPGPWIAKMLDGRDCFHWSITVDQVSSLAIVNCWRGQALGNISQETANANARLIAAAPELLAVAEMVKPHGEKLREKARWLQEWLHESAEGKALSEVTRSSFGQFIAELQQLATGSRLPQATRAAVAKATGE